MARKKTTARRNTAANRTAPRNTRTTRAQETHEAEDIHEEYPEVWEDPSILTAPDPRPGYAQRWVRTKLNGNDDQRNLIKKLNQYWRPRAADTVPKGMFAPTINHGEYGNVVGTHDMLLMERPLRVHQAQAASVKEDTRNLEQVVRRNLGKTYEGEAGFRRPEMSVSSRVSKGRPVEVADD